MPQLQYRRPIDQSVGLLQMAMQKTRAIGERHASPGIAWSLGRSRLVECAQKASKGDGRRRKVLRWRMQRTRPRKPRRDRPRPRKTAARAPDAARYRRRQWQLRRQPRQPTLLQLDQNRRRLAPRDTNGKVVAQPKQPVVPSLSDIRQCQIGQVPVLFLDKGADQRLIN